MVATLMATMATPTAILTAIPMEIPMVWGPNKRWGERCQWIGERFFEKLFLGSMYGIFTHCLLILW